MNQSGHASRVGISEPKSEGEAQFRAIAEAMPQMVFRTTVDGQVDFFNSSWYAFTGMPAGSGEGNGWQAALHPDDVGRVAAIWTEARRTGEPCEDEYRLRHHSGEWRWVLTRAQPVKDALGDVIQWMGTSTDIHAIKTADRQRELMLGEMNHRVKNTLTLVQSVVSQTLRQVATVDEARSSIQARIVALGRAHDELVHSQWSAARIGAVVESALAPHWTGTGRFEVGGPDLPVGSSQALALTMALHELATNAIKYGALSDGAGRVEVTWGVEADGGSFRFVWAERGGPEVSAPSRRGFGSRMVEQALAGYFGGASALTFEPSGVRFELTAPAEGLTA